MPSSRLRTRLVILIAACSSLGCSRIFEDRGPLLAKDAAAFAPNLVWTADGTEVVYVAESLVQGSMVRTLHAVRVADGTVRQLDVAAPLPDPPLARAADGSALYYVTADGTLRDALSGKDVGRGPSFVSLMTSADGRLVGYWDRGATAPGAAFQGAAFLLDVDRGTSTLLPLCGSEALAFSPSGDAVLCADVSTTGPPFIERFDVVDVATVTVREQFDPVVFPQDVRWGSNGVQLAGAQAGDAQAIAVNDLGTGTARVVYRLPPPSSDAVKKKDFPSGNRVSGATFSADGRQLAFWAAECHGGNFLEPEYCGTAQGSLIIVDLDTGSQRVVASGEATYDGGGGAGPVAFSDDGALIAYRFRSEIHVRPTHH